MSTPRFGSRVTAPGLVKNADTRWPPLRRRDSLKDRRVAVDGHEGERDAENCTVLVGLGSQI
jgi:hypothetical protein